MIRFVLLLLTSFCVFAQVPEDLAWQSIDAGLKDSNPAKRIAAVIAMSVVRPQPRPVMLVEAMLEDKDLGVREAACTTLGDMKSLASIPVLQRSLEDKAPEVVFAAARALYAMNDPTGRGVLTEVLLGDQKDSSGFVTTSIRGAKLKLHDPKALLLVGVNQAAALLGPVGAGLPVAEQLLKDGQSSGKTIAALLLSTDTSVESRSAMKQALRDKNWTVRAAAARAIALRDISEYYTDVATLLDDKRDEVRYSAAVSMIRLKQPGPTPLVPKPPARHSPARKTAK